MKDANFTYADCPECGRFWPADPLTGHDPNTLCPNCEDALEAERTLCAPELDPAEILAYFDSFPDRDDYEDEYEAGEDAHV